MIRWDHDIQRGFRGAIALVVEAALAQPALREQCRAVARLVVRLVARLVFGWANP
ncbi:hypothetical protein [Thermoleptolyngbya sp.]